MTDQPEADAPLQVLMIGFAVPDAALEAICRTDRYMPVQTHKLSWSVIRGLESSGCRVDLISSLPVSTFPAGRPLLVAGARPLRAAGEWVLLPFVNLIVLKHMTRFLSCLWFTSQWLRSRTRAQRRVILLYGIHSAHMWSALLAQVMFGATIVTLVTDPPSVSLAGEGIAVGWLRWLDSWLLRRALRAMDGVVCLTRGLADTFAPNVPALIMEGILSSQDLERFGASAPAAVTESQSPPPFIVFYAGGLEASYGVTMLLEAFAQLEGSDWRLWVCGRGQLAGRIAQAAERDSRVVDWGFLPHHEVLTKLTQSTVLVNARPSSQGFTAFSFPSKTIEYMASGRPTVSTALPGIPEEYLRHLQVLREENVSGLAALLTTLHGTPRETLAEFGRRAKEFVTATKSEASQGGRLRSFLEQVLSTEGAGSAVAVRGS